MADGRRQLVEPGAGDIQVLQAVQAFQGAGCRVGVIRWRCPWLANACAEIHQASAEAKQYGGQAGGGEGRASARGMGTSLK